MDKNNKIPEIRFKGYNDDWEEKTLGSLFEITSASRVLKNEWTEFGVPFFRSSDVVSDYKKKDNIKAFISLELYKKLSTISGCVQKNDILVTGGGSIGIPYLVKTNEPLYFKDADLLWLKSANKVNGYFLYTFFSTTIFRNYVNSITHIGTISHYTIEQAKSTPIIIPTQTEQKKIGSFFQNLDNFITLHQKKYDKLVVLKKAMLVKMFAKKGALVPEIRFKGFSGDWEEMKLGDTVPLRGGFAFKSDNFINNGIPIVKISNILPSGKIGGKFNYYKEQIADENYTIPNNAALLAMSGATTGKVSILSNPTEKKIYQNQRVGYFEDRDLVNYQFISAILRSNLFSDKINSILTTGAQPNISSKEIDFFEFYVPTDRLEQKKIGKYFRNLDNQIELHKTQLEKLNNIKKACFTKMFVTQD